MTEATKTETKPSVIRFEQAVAKKDYEEACNEIFKILASLDGTFGAIDEIELDYPEQLLAQPLAQEKDIYFCTRMATAISQMFQDPSLEITEAGSQRLFTFQRWINYIFASSPYVNADHVLRSYNINPNPQHPNDLHIESSPKAFIKFCLMYLAESNIVFNLDNAWQVHRPSCVGLCFGLHSARFIGTPQAFSKRAATLPWLKEKLPQFADMDNLPNAVLHDVYMHCSYDMAADKHSVKQSLNKLIRRHMLKGKWQDRKTIKKLGYRDGKPVMLVLLEHFNSSHSIYRTHSTSIRAAREHFYIIGIGNKEADEPAKAVFDEFHILPEGNVFGKLKFVKELSEQNGIAILYMPSIGMDLHTIFASNARLAPIQAVALGHPATTHSKYIEYVVVEDDYVGSEDCFSETLLRLPKDALPYVPSAQAPKSVNYILRENPEVVNIGIASTTMKLNPYFLEALKLIRDRAKVKVHFHFAMGQSRGISHPYIARFIRSYLGDDATAHAQVPYSDYLEILRQCDMMVNPFPFGNTNGIIDMVTLGLVGVCKTGPEVHEHIDEGLFKRLGLPDWLVAHSIEEYVQNAIRLAENHQERLALRRKIIEDNGLQTLFSGDPRPMGRVFLAKLKEWAKENGVKLELPQEEEAKGAKSTKTAKPTKGKRASKSVAKGEGKS